MSSQYDLYLKHHKENVIKCFEWLQTNMPYIFKDKPDSSWQIIFNHDQSKFEQDEYNACDTYLYGNNQSYAAVEAYKKARLLHFHRNPHHWQFWIFNSDDPNVREMLIEMPFNYIIEMICDWWAHSLEYGDMSLIFYWYDNNKDYIKLAPKTRKNVEYILLELRERLGYNTIAHHGIKGQKWGVRNGPPYPLDKSIKYNKIIDEIDKSEKIINKEKQARHTVYGHIEGRSYINGDLKYAQKLIDELSGTGEPKFDRNGNWVKKEIVTADEIIGMYVDPYTGEETPSNKAVIIYSKTGAHIYPVKKGENYD